MAWRDIVVSFGACGRRPCPHVPRRLLRHVALAQRTRLRPQLPHDLYNQQYMGAADDIAGVAGSAGAGGLDDSALAAARMVEGMPRLSALDLSGVGCSDSFMAFLRAAQRHLQARQHLTAVAGYSTIRLRTVNPALLAAYLPHLEQFEGELPYACGAQCLQVVTRACPLQQLSCSMDQCDEATAAAIGACTTLRGVKLELRHYSETKDADVSITGVVRGGLLLPDLAGLTRLTSLEVASKEVDLIRWPSLNVPWPDLAPLAALNALQRLHLSWCGFFTSDFSLRLSQLPAGSLGALTQLRLHDTSDMARLDDAGLAALARAAPALQDLEANWVVGLDDVAPGSVPPWTMTHLTTLSLGSRRGRRCVSVVCAAALLARAPRLRGQWALLDVFTTAAVPFEMQLRALAHIAAAGRATLGRLVVARLPPAAELQAAMAVAAPGGIALELPTLKVMCPAAYPLGDPRMAWLCSVVAGVDLVVDVQLPDNSNARALSRGIFALPAAAFSLCVGFTGCCLVEAVRFAVEAGRPGQQVCVQARQGVFGTDAIAEAEAIARGALGKDIRVQIGGQVD